jgi:hypothetical protein
LMFLELIDAGAEAAVVRETLEGQLHERMKMQVWDVGVRQFWDHGQQMVVSY